MPEVTSEEIAAVQGTQLSETPPWMSYAAEMDEKLDPKLEAEIDAYASNRHEESSNQNKEELHRWQEENAAIAAEYQWLKPEEYADEEARIGKVRHSSDFINTLRNECKVKCWYRDHPQPGRLTLMVQKKDGAELELGCWVQAGHAPEFSMMKFDDHGVPLDEKRRGWRTCLLQLILKGMISETTVNKVFGEARGPASKRYNQTLHDFRNSSQENI